MKIFYFLFRNGIFPKKTGLFFDVIPVYSYRLTSYNAKNANKCVPKPQD